MADAIASAHERLVDEARAAVQQAEEALVNGTTYVDLASSSLAIAIARLRTLENRLRQAPKSGSVVAPQLGALRNNIARVSHLLEQVALFQSQLMRRISEGSREPVTGTPNRGERSTMVA